MNYSLIACVVCIIMIANAVYSEPTAEKVLHRERISEQAELIVTQEPMVKVSAMKAVLPHNISEGTLGYISVNVLFHSPPEPPLRLWSRRYPVHKVDFDERAVLDVLVLPDRVVIAFAGTLKSISLLILDFRPTGFDQVTSLRGWRQIASPSPEQELGVMLTYNEPEDRIEVVVTDWLVDQEIRQHTIFHQTPGEWNFVRVQQWRETVPRPAPAE